MCACIHRLGCPCARGCACVEQGSGLRVGLFWSRYLNLLIDRALAYMCAPCTSLILHNARGWHRKAIRREEQPVGRLPASSRLLGAEVRPKRGTHQRKERRSLKEVLPTSDSAAACLRLTFGGMGRNGTSRNRKAQSERHFAYLKQRRRLLDGELRQPAAVRRLVQPRVVPLGVGHPLHGPAARPVHAGVWVLGAFRSALAARCTPGLRLHRCRV
jgi:hypothetical protein